MGLFKRLLISDYSAFIFLFALIYLVMSGIFMSMAGTICIILVVLSIAIFYLLYKECLKIGRNMIKTGKFDYNDWYTIGQSKK
jgi:hypothetical protein